MGINLDEFVDLPGFYQLEKRELPYGQPPGVVRIYKIGIDPYTSDGQPSSNILWGEGASIAGALENWWFRHGQTQPKSNAQVYWRKQSVKLGEKKVRA